MISAYGKSDKRNLVITYNLKSLSVITMLVVFLAIPPHIIASDRDTPAFLIYVDPVTGKYTKKKPEHETNLQQSEATSAAPITPRPDPPDTRLTPAFLIAGGLLLSSYVLTSGMVKLRKKILIKDQAL